MIIRHHILKHHIRELPSITVTITMTMTTTVTVSATTINGIISYECC